MMNSMKNTNQNMKLTKEQFKLSSETKKQNKTL